MLLELKTRRTFIFPKTVLENRNPRLPLPFISSHFFACIPFVLFPRAESHHLSLLRQSNFPTGVVNHLI